MVYSLLDDLKRATILFRPCGVVLMDVKEEGSSWMLRTLFVGALTHCPQHAGPVAERPFLYALSHLLAHRGFVQESPAIWKPADFTRLLEERVHVQIEGRRVTLKAWCYEITGANGYVVLLLLLDANVSENSPSDRQLTDWLYGGDQRYRLAQEIILGKAAFACCGPWGSLSLNASI